MFKLRITNNTIDTPAGNLVIDPAGGTIQVNDNIEIQGPAKPLIHYI